LSIQTFSLVIDEFKVAALIEEGITKLNYTSNLALEISGIRGVIEDFRISVQPKMSTILSLVFGELDKVESRDSVRQILFF
jgi:hypothetical protein